MKPFYLLHTDFYQVSMSMAYMLQGSYDDTPLANVETGYELFVRGIKADVNPSKDVYVFYGSHVVKKFMDTVKAELLDPELKTTFKALILPKFATDPDRQNDYSELLDAYWSTLRTDFTYKVVPNGTHVHPFFPVFQYKGPRWIGQLIETAISVICNARTGLMTRERFGLLDVDLDQLRPLVDPNHASHPNEVAVISEYLSDLRARADQFRAATTVSLLEAGFRRAPSFSLAVKGAEIAIEQGWDSTSNIASHFYANVPIDKLYGTMAHAFVMSFENELDAFRSWNSFFPNSTVIGDTHDTIDAAQMIVTNDIRISKFRIDSGDLAYGASKVQAIFDAAGWYDSSVSISGDISPETLIQFHADNVPFTGTMAGTELYHNGITKHINSGFVYKTVQFEGEHGLVLPRKKATGKTNPPGLKRMYVKDDTLVIDCKPKKGYGITAADAARITRDMKIDIINS